MSTFEADLALLDSVKRGDVEVVRCLLDGGADPAVRDFSDGRSALRLAVAGEHWEIARLLAERGAPWEEEPGEAAPEADRAGARLIAGLLAEVVGGVAGAVAASGQPLRRANS
jgi:hypothetical protein